MKAPAKQQVKATPKKKLTANVKKGENRISLRSDGGGPTVGQ
jgi:hypothetical protein